MATSLRTFSIARIRYSVSEDMPNLTNNRHWLSWKKCFVRRTWSYVLGLATVAHTYYWWSGPSGQNNIQHTYILASGAIHLISMEHLSKCCSAHWFYHRLVSCTWLSHSRLNPPTSCVLCNWHMHVVRTLPIPYRYLRRNRIPLSRSKFLPVSRQCTLIFLDFRTCLLLCYELLNCYERTLSWNWPPLEYFD